MKGFLRKAFDIRPEEVTRAVLMFAYIFLIISCLLMLKPTRNSLFLSRFSATQLPYVFILVAVSAALITVVYARFAQKLRLDKLIRGTLLIFIVNLAGFWILLRNDMQAAWFIYSFYVWVAIFGAITTSQFWILANYIFNAREARRLFGFVGAGAISGGIVGGYLTNLARVIGTDNLLLICLLFLLSCLVILQYVWRLRPQDPGGEQQRRRRQMRTTAASSANPVTLLKSSRHLRYVAAIVGVSVIVANLVDYQFNAVAQAGITSKDDLTAFFGIWLSNLSIISLAFQLFATGRLLKTFGVGASLFFLPLGILGGALALFLFPVLWAAVLIKVSDGAFKQSINKAGIELLILPVPREIKAQAKAFIDVFVDSLATGIGGVLLIICTAVLGLAISGISLLSIALIVIWLGLIFRVREAYIEAFRLAIEKRSIDLEEYSVNLQDASLFENLLVHLRSDNPRQIVYVLKLLENVGDDRFLPHLRRLIQHPAADVKIQVLRMLAEFREHDLSAEVRPLVQHVDSEVRLEAINYLIDNTSDQNRPRLIREFMEHSDYRLRAGALICLARAGVLNAAIHNTYNLPQILRQAGDSVNDLPADNERAVFFKSCIARAVGVSHDPQLYHFLESLLADPSPIVQGNAIVSAGQLQSHRLLPSLIALLEDKHFRKTVREALADYGEPVIPILIDQFTRPDTSRAIRLNIPRVLSLIGSQESVDALLPLLDIDDLPERFQVLKALNKLRQNYPWLRFNEGPIEKKIVSETGDYMAILSVLYTQSDIQQNGRENAALIHSARRLLIRALEEKLDTNLERIFRLLGLRYKPKDMLYAYMAIDSDKQDLRASAVEFLDNVLDNNLKHWIIPIVESTSVRQLMDIGRDRFNLKVPDENECLRMLLENHDPWLISCALYLVAAQGDRRLLAEVRNLQSHPNPVVRETAHLANHLLTATGR